MKVNEVDRLTARQTAVTGVAIVHVDIVPFGRCVQASVESLHCRRGIVGRGAGHQRILRIVGLSRMNTGVAHARAQSVDGSSCPAAHGRNGLFPLNCYHWCVTAALAAAAAAARTGRVHFTATLRR